MGKILTEEAINLVESLYQDDEYSRPMPGRKDFVSISCNVHMQKRLVLCNLKELYIAFKNSYPNHKVNITITF